MKIRRAYYYMLLWFKRLFLKGIHPERKGRNDAERNLLQCHVMSNSRRVELRCNELRLVVEAFAEYRSCVKLGMGQLYSERLRKEEEARHTLRVVYEKLEAVRKEQGECIEYYRLNDDLEKARTELQHIQTVVWVAEQQATDLVEQGRVNCRARMMSYLKGVEQAWGHKVPLDLPYILENPTEHLYLSEPDAETDAWILRGVVT